MDQPKIIKKVDPIICPHCNKNVYVASQAMMSTVFHISTDEEMKESKKKIKEELENLEFSSEEDKQQLIEWIDREDTLLDKTDIEPLLQQVGADQASKISKQATAKDMSEEKKDEKKK